MAGTLDGRIGHVIPWQIPYDFHCLNFSRTKCRIIFTSGGGGPRCRFFGAAMAGGLPHQIVMRWRRLGSSLCLAVAAVALTDCAGGNSEFYSNTPPQQSAAAPPASTLGEGQVRVALILPLSGQGNAGVAAQPLKNPAEMALANFKNPNIQLLVKDDGGTPQGAQVGAQQAINEGAEIIIGPLFAEAVRAVGATARPHGIPVIAFSTDASVAARGVYLLSFLPETDVKRIVDYVVSRGKRSFGALLPDSAYGAVVEAAFQQEVSRRGGRVVVLEKYSTEPGKIAEAAHRVAQAVNPIDATFIPDRAEGVPQVVQTLLSDGVIINRVQLLGTGLWDDPRIFSTPSLDGGWYGAPASVGFRHFFERS